MDMKNEGFFKLSPSSNLPWDHVRILKNLGRIGLALVIFIGHRLTDNIYIILVDQAEDENSLYFIVRTGRSSLQQTDRQTIHIYYTC